MQVVALGPSAIHSLRLGFPLEVRNYEMLKVDILAIILERPAVAESSCMNNWCGSLARLVGSARDPEPLRYSGQVSAGCIGRLMPFKLTS